MEKTPLEELLEVLHAVGIVAVEAKEIIDNSGLNVISAVLLKEAAHEVSNALV